MDIVDTLLLVSHTFCYPQYYKYYAPSTVQGVHSMRNNYTRMH